MLACCQVGNVRQNPLLNDGMLIGGPDVGSSDRLQRTAFGDQHPGIDLGDPHRFVDHVAPAQPGTPDPLQIVEARADIGWRQFDRFRKAEQRHKALGGRPGLRLVGHALDCKAETAGVGAAVNLLGEDRLLEGTGLIDDK